VSHELRVVARLDLNGAPKQLRDDPAPAARPEREPYVPTPVARQAVDGRETEILNRLGISWCSSKPHIRCPYPDHDDRDPSWRWDESKAHAFCTCSSGNIFDVIGKIEHCNDFDAQKLRAVELIGREDLIVDPNKPASIAPGLSIEEYANAKGLPLDLLQRYKIRQARYGQHFPKTVRFPYYHLDDGPPAMHFRVALNGPKNDRFRWGKGDKTSLYGLHWADQFSQLGYCVLVEGETDALTLWMHEIPAMGLPGATTWSESRYAPVLAGIPLFFVMVEPDKGGEVMLSWLARSAIAPRARLVRMPAGIKDPSELFLADRAGFRSVFGRALESAAPFPQSQIAKRPTIIVRGGVLHELADAGLAAMQAARIEFYQRDRSLVRVARIKAKASDGTIVTTPGIIPVPLPMLRRALGQSADWAKVSPKGEQYAIDPPKEVNEQIAAMVGDWPFPPLSGVINTPTLRPDGSLLLKEGYDEATGLVLLLPPTVPAISDRPTKADAEKALALLDALLNEFPFTNDQSRSVALSMLLTPVLRGGIPPAVPIHLVTKPAAGTGGSYLSDIASAIATGERCAVISIAANDPAETEKRLVGAAISGFPIIALDNCSVPLDGDFLCQVSERPLLQLRPLGQSQPVRVANSFTIFANGNQASVTNDVVRRTIQCGIDANMENPEDREFKCNPLAVVLADRGPYVAACLIIARAYIAAGRPGKLKPLPSFERWSDTVRSALCWLGRADPVSTISAARSEDPVRQERLSVFKAWATEYVIGMSLLTSEIIKAAEDVRSTNGSDDPGGWQRPALHDALLVVAEQRAVKGKIDATKLGQWLARNVNNVAGIYKLTADRSDSARPRWRLVPAQ